MHTTSSLLKKPVEEEEEEAKETMADLAAEAAATAASRKEHIIEVGRGGKEGEEKGGNYFICVGHNRIESTLSCIRGRERRIKCELYMYQTLAVRLSQETQELSKCTCTCSVC